MYLKPLISLIMDNGNKKHNAVIDPCTARYSQPYMNSVLSTPHFKNTFLSKDDTICRVTRVGLDTYYLVGYAGSEHVYEDIDLEK